MTASSATADLPSSIGASAPLTVLFSFLSRADSTPLDQRSRAKGHLLDRDGAVVPDPALDPALNAFEADPNLNFEKWGEYWRKVHGIRFLHPEAVEDEATINRLLRYDQIHRLAAGPTDAAPLPYRPPLAPDGKLFDTVIGHIKPYRRPAWDGVAYLSFRSIEDLGLMLGAERVRRAILPEDQVIFRDLAPFLARQYIMLPNTVGNDALVLVKSHTRRVGLDRESFQARWLSDHASIVLAELNNVAGVTRYAQLHNIGPTHSGQPFFHSATAGIDGVTLMAFASMRDLERFLQSDSNAAIHAAEQSIMDVSAGGYWTGLVLTVVDQLAPEHATAR